MITNDVFQELLKIKGALKDVGVEEDVIVHLQGHVTLTLDSIVERLYLRGIRRIDT